MSYVNDIIENVYYYNNNNNTVYNGFNSESEILSKLIIDKIISLVINEVFVQETFKNNPDYIFNNMKNIIKPLIKLDHINYDKDSYIDNEVNEPQKISLDIYLSNYIKYRILNDNIKEIIEDNKIKKSKNQKHISNNSFKILSNSNLINLNKEKSPIKETLKTKKSFLNNNFETFSIKDIPINEEPKEIETLRYQYENELRAKIERQQVKDIQKTKLINPKKNQNKKANLPIIDSEKYSFDSNGKIINIIPNNNFNLIKEFQEIPLKTKFIKLQPKEDDFYNFQPPPKEKIPVEKQSEKISKLNEMINETKKLLKGNYYINIKKTTKTKIVPVKERGKILYSRCPPSGDNFTYFNPEIGVSIKSNNREKNGSFQYSKLYNRYSNIEFNNMLEEVVHINKSKIKNDSFNKNNMENNDESVINQNNDDNSIIDLSSSNISVNRKIQNSFLQSQNKKNLLSDRAYSFNQIILNKSLLNNSSLLDSVDDYNKSFENDKINSLKINYSLKNLFINKMNNVRLKKNQSFTKMIKSENEAKSFDLIDKFNKNLIKNRGIYNDYNYYNNKNILPELKKPLLPKFTKLIKRNGLLVKSNLPLRINFAKNNSQ